MRTSDTIDKLATAFTSAQAQLKNAAFDKINPHFNSKYSTLAGVRDTVVPVLSEFGLSVIQGAAIQDGVNVITTRLMHSSGQWIESAYPFVIDKPQNMGSAMTYARRYSLAAICGISSEEDDDGNAAQQGETATPKAPHDANPLVRGVYTRLDNGLNQISRSGVATIEDLKLYWKNNAETIAKLPAGFKKELEAKKDEIKTSLQAKAA